MKKLLIVFLISLSLMLGGCPKQSIEKAKANSAKVATYANAGVDLTRELWRANFLSLEQKDRVAEAWIVLARAGIAFDAAIANIEGEYGIADVPKSEIEKLFAVFNREVVGKFLDVLTALKLTTRAGEFGTIIESIKTAVLIVAGYFNRRSEVAAQLSGA